MPRTPKTSTWITLAGLLTLATLAGCASDSQPLDRTAGNNTVTGLGDDQDEALDNARAHALAQCQAHQRDEFDILEQRMTGPSDGLPSTTDTRTSPQGATVDEDTELQAATQEGDGYKATWTIRCR
ncbi:hypothetical protein BTW08_06915 [Salinicola sp. MH3R3-1]|uniref:hypothetical protein n=1 Tax=Salinicola sp. MH3R3-1 TaxID=1928762 RepID=UPI00094E7674|nr:hypothetical protein [Salinicola sp. MH3R3-1]OLO08460.1 hypothetical protein BTW08_06915 [Salinicola sp. MH3R3-1]